LQKFISLS